MVSDRSRRIHQLKEVAAAATTGDLEHVYNESIKALRLILDPEFGSLQLLDDGGQGLRFVATLVPEDLPRLQADDPIPIDEESISGFVVRNGEPLLFDDSWKDPLFGTRQRKIAEEKNVGNRSYICVPLVARGKILGALSILHSEPNQFTEDDKNLAISLASFIAMSVDYAQFEERLRQVATAVSSLELDLVYEEAMRALRILSGTEIGSLQLLDDDSQGLRFVATLVPEELPRLQADDPIPIDEESISGFVVRNGEPLLFDDSWKDPLFGTRQRKIAEEKNVGNRSYICVPLVVQKNIIGVLNVLHREPGRFSKLDLKMAIILASFIAVAIHNARQMQALLEAQRRQANIERAATMADIANNFVHRINNDLGLVKTYIRQLERYRDTGDLNDEYLWNKLSAVKDAASKTLELVSGFKDFERVQKAEFINVKDCISKAIRDLEFYGGDLGAEIIVDFDKDPILVFATQQLTDVFENLMRNSRDAMQSSTESKIIIALEDAWEDHLRISVTDTGPGVSPKIKDQLFKLGITTKTKEQGGGGYGLWWIQVWLQRIGGNIYYDESYQGGARFLLDLPLAPHSMTI